MFDTYKFNQQALAFLLYNSEKIREHTSKLFDNYSFNEYHAIIYKEIKEYINKYNITPDDSHLLHIIKEKFGSKIDYDIIKKELVDILKLKSSINTDDFKYVKDILNKGYKDIRSAIFLEELIDSHNNHTLIDTIDDLTEDFKKDVVEVDDIHSNIFFDVDNVFMKDEKNKIATPWPSLNKITNGGLGSGELGVIIAPTGRGKSFTLINIAHTAIKKEFRVGFISLEMSVENLSKRLYALILNKSLLEIEYYKDELKDELKKYEGLIEILYFPAYTISPQNVERIIKEKKFDIVLIDYPDLLKSSLLVKDRPDLNIQRTYEYLHSIAGKLEIPIWTVSQANREGSSTDNITLANSSESYSKTFTADLILSLNQDKTRQQINEASFSVLKNRSGVLARNIPLKMELHRSKITELEDTISKSEQIKRSLLNKKFKGGLEE